MRFPPTLQSCYNRLAVLLVPVGLPHRSAHARRPTFEYPQTTATFSCDLNKSGRRSGDIQSNNALLVQLRARNLNATAGRGGQGRACDAKVARWV